MGNIALTVFEPPVEFLPALKFPDGRSIIPLAFEVGAGVRWSRERAEVIPWKDGRVSRRWCFVWTNAHRSTAHPEAQVYSPPVISWLAFLAGRLAEDFVRELQGVAGR